MERTARRVRPTRMMDQRLLRGRAGFAAVAGIGLLFAAVSGCGSVVASDPPSAAGAAGAPAAAAGAATTTAAPQVGCASVSQATSVSIRNALHMMVPVNTKARATTYRGAAKVQALFGQLCAAVTHPAPNQLMHCPADIGTEWLGTFYDGSRALATFTYTASGCERVSVTAAGKTLSTGLYGSAAAAAPRLAIDLAAIVGEPRPGTMQPQGGVNPGGPNKPA